MNCKSYGFIYLLQCKIYHLQYVGKSETAFTPRQPQKTVKQKKKNASTFKLSTIISKETKCYNRTVVTSSKKERNIRTNMLKTLHPGNLSQEFNDV